jgi:pimeloyl-ACP methyl ester carboxylesterase
MIARDHHLSHGCVRVVDMGEGPPLVLLHGLGGTWRNWAYNLPGLSKRHRVIAFDLPGFGASVPYAGSVTMERYVDTIVELLDRLGIERATFAGNSMGGLLTIETAVRHPDRVHAAILVNSGGLPLTSRRHRFVTIPQARVFHMLMRSRRVRGVATSSWGRRILGRQLVHDPQAIAPAALIHALTGLGAPGFAPALKAGTRYDARVRAPRVGCPTLVLWGREDRLLPVSTGEQLHRLIPGSELVVWDATGHCPMLEHPLRFETLMATFTTRQEQHA